MIDPTRLTKFEEELAKLVGESIDEVDILIQGKKLIRRIIRFGIDPKIPSYRWLSFEKCPSQILYRNLVLNFYPLNSPTEEEAQIQFELLKGDVVDSVHFDVADFSLLIRLNSDFVLKLLPDKEYRWNYSISSVYGSNRASTSYSYLVLDNEIAFIA